MIKLIALIALIYLVNTNLCYAKNLDLIVGGFNSCAKVSYPNRVKTYSVKKSGFYRSYKKHSKNLQRDHIASCFEWSGKQGLKPDDFQLRVYDSRFPEKREFHLSYKKYLRYISVQDDHLVNIIGHSHGGWIGMRLVLKFSETIKIQKLVTVDPISKIHCNTKKIFGETTPCKVFPQDFSLEDLDSIFLSVEQWHHFFQLNTTRLHSGKAPIEISTNKQIKNSSHTKIDQSPIVWEAFFEQI